MVINENLQYVYDKTNRPQRDDFYKHLHNGYEMLYFIDGDADYVIGSCQYRLQKSDLLIIKPACYHYLNLRSAAPYERIVINFTEGAVSPALREDLQNLRDIYRIAKDGVIGSLLLGLPSAEKTFDECDFRAAAEQTVNLILTHLKYEHDDPEEPGNVSVNVTLGNILRYIDENPTLPLDAETLSAKFFVSPSWITHTFHKHMGIGVKQYINRKRILYAQKLMQNGVQATEAAKICSFENYSTFYRRYKKFVGQIPKVDKQ